MSGKQELYVMILGDFSPCLEHLIRAYYIAKTGKDSKFFLEESENSGLEIFIDNEVIRVHLQVATTRRKASQQSADEFRLGEYRNRFTDIDLIILCFYQNNSKSTANVHSKYTKELETWYAKVPFYLMGLTINEVKDGVVAPLRETISIQDRWLKRDLDVTPKESKKLAKAIKSRGLLQCTVISTEPHTGEDVLVDDDIIEQYKDVEKAIDKAIKNVLKKSNRTCIFPFG